MRRDNHRLPPFIPGGSPQNPMGVAAMTLSGGELAIHGTNEPKSLGHCVPYGSIQIRKMVDISCTMAPLVRQKIT